MQILNGLGRTKRVSADSAGLAGAGLAGVAGADGVFEQDESGEGRIGPSGMIGGNDLPLVQVRPPATVKEIREIIEAYGVAAKTA